MASNTLTDLQIVSPTVQAASAETRRKYQYALDMGVLACPTAKVMFLGDRGVGKSSTKDLLLGKEHTRHDQSSNIIKNYVTETKTMNEEWKMCEDVLTEYQNSEYQRALAHFCAFVPVNFIPTQREKIMRIIRKIVEFLGVILVAGFSGSWFLSSTSLGYPLLLIFCTLLIAVATRNFTNGFTIGNGLAAVIVVGHFFVSHPWRYLHPLTEVSRLVVLGLVGAVSGYFCGALLALGVGAGVSISFSLLRYENPPSNAALLNLSLFMIGCLLAIFIESKPVKRLHPLLTWAVVPLGFILSVLLLHSAVDDVPTVTHFVSGFLFGCLFISGQKQGRKLAHRAGLGHTNRILTDVIGGAVGFGFGFFVLAWNIPRTWLELAAGSVGVIFCIAAELYRNHIIVNDKMPTALISKMMRENDRHWPAKLNLLDCKSSRIYDNAHHIFMSRHCLYLLLFRLDRLRDDFDGTFERLLFWMNSVFAHARHQDAKVFLTATHKTAIQNDSDRTVLLQRLHDKVRQPFGERLVMNERKEMLVFAVDNVFRENNDDDVPELKRIIFEKAMGAEYTTNPNRVTWFAFLDIIRDRKKCIITNPKSAIIKCNDLWVQVKKPCHLNVQSEFYRMLKYFHDCGEIYYDDSDPILCRYVVLNPQYLIDAVGKLLDNRTLPEEHGRLQMLREDFTKNGIISHDVLKETLRDIVDEEENLIRLLVSLNVLLPVNRNPERTIYDRFIVPFLLPNCPDDLPVAVPTPDCICVFDFNSFYPEPVFLHLLAQCLALSFRTTEQYGLVVSEKDLRFFRNEGCFFFADAILYSIHLYKRQSRTNQIWVRAQALPSEHHKGDLYDFLLQLNVLMSRICWRHFEFLEYQYKVLCDCCLQRCTDTRGVMEDLIWHTVVDHALNAQSNVSQFPPRDKSFFCSEEKKLVRIKGSSSDIDEKNLESETLIRNIDNHIGKVDDFFTYDAFISCCSEDRIFVLQDLLPILENASSASFGNNQTECLALAVNDYDNPNPNYDSEYSPTMMNVEKMKMSRCVIAVISQSYHQSSRCKKELQYAVMMKKTVIPVIIVDCCPPPASLGNVKSITYPSDRERVREEFYIKLIRSVKACLPQEPRPSVVNQILNDFHIRPSPPSPLTLR